LFQWNNSENWQTKEDSNIQIDKNIPKWKTLISESNGKKKIQHIGYHQTTFSGPGYMTPRICALLF
jgi:hypothetical protein